MTAMWDETIGKKNLREYMEALLCVKEEKRLQCH